MPWSSAALVRYQTNNLGTCFLIHFHVAVVDCLLVEPMTQQPHASEYPISLDSRPSDADATKQQTTTPVCAMSSIAAVLANTTFLFQEEDEDKGNQTVELFLQLWSRRS